MTLEQAQDLTVAADYGQIYIYAYRRPSPAGENVFYMALVDAVSSRRFVGIAPGFIDLMTPGQWNAHTPLRLETQSAMPERVLAEWDHVVEVDFDCESGTVCFEASGGGRRMTTEVPPGRYRVRVSGAGFGKLGYAGRDGDDHYLMQFWPRTEDSPPALLKYWPGWDDYASPW